MNTTEFNAVVNDQLTLCASLLIDKGNEYANDVDRLQHFKKAGAFMSTTPKAALLGMAAKHFVSVSDMCLSTEQFAIAKWNEKITDAINYLLLLKAIVCEEAAK